jgi:hypothetical protein
MAVCTRAVIKVTPRADAMLAFVSTFTILFAGPDALSMQEPAYSPHNGFHSGCRFHLYGHLTSSPGVGTSGYFCYARGVSAPNVIHGTGEDSPGVYRRMKLETAAIKEVPRLFPEPQCTS